jgi:hypothetical protein
LAIFRPDHRMSKAMPLAGDQDERKQGRIHEPRRRKTESHVSPRLQIESPIHRDTSYRHQVVIALLTSCSYSRDLILRPSPRASTLAGCQFQS